MDENMYLSGVICEQLSHESPVILASIIKLQGSSPRHSGTKMVIGVNGKSYGTIGGSLMEASVISEASIEIEQGLSKLLNFDLTGSGVESKGMICGGKTTILLDFISPSKENLELFQHYYEAISNSKEFYFLTRWEEANERVNILGHSLLFADGTLTGDCNLPEGDVNNIIASLPNISTTTIIKGNSSQVVVYPVVRRKTLYCFGAGHVALPTAHVAALVGFRVVVLDDRAEFANSERFPDAVEIDVIEDFNHALDKLEIDKDSFIIIVTRGHRFDREVLEQALKTNAGYIGMIGSRKKRDTIYAALRAQGVTEKELGRVHSPIGIAIDAETPEEISVSIVAELISERKKTG